jgi:hypothetical protein
MFSILIRPFGACPWFSIFTSKGAGTASSIRVSRRQRVRARWQRNANGSLRISWESVAKPPTEEDAAPKHSGSVRRRHIAAKSSNSIALGVSRRHLAA